MADIMTNGQSKFKYFATAIVVLLFFGEGEGASAKERPEYLDFALAYPLSTQIPPIEGPVPFSVNEITARITLEIDVKGKVLKAQPERTEDSLLSQYAFSSIERIPFQPALRKKMAVASSICIDFSFNPRYRSASIVYPVDSFFNVIDPGLYFKALEKNGFEMPGLEKFPTYFCNLRPVDSLPLLPFVLLKVELDESGNSNTSQIVKTTLPAFAEQVKSASLWGKYSPLKNGGKTQAATAFVLVSFLPQLQYPTKAFEKNKDSLAAWFDRWRVRLVPDTVGYLNPPIPKYKAIDELSLLGDEKYLSGEVVVGISIDSSGVARFAGSDTKQDKLNNSIRAVIKGMKFFPAVDYSGKAISFYGKVRFKFSNRDKASVEYLWLN